MSAPDVELEERLSQLGPAFKGGIEPPATLHVTVMAATSAPRTPARRSMLREVSLAAAVIAFVGLLAFGFSRLHSLTPGPVKPSPAPSPASRVIPWISTPVAAPSFQPRNVLTPYRAAQDIKKTVITVDPVLLPGSIPAGFQAQVYDDQGGFSVLYAAADGRRMSFAIALPNPGPGTSRVRQVQLAFRGVRANYQVDDISEPTSHRWLMWNEPGTWVRAPRDVPYSFTSAGLTEEQFWAVANSIGLIPPAITARTCAPADLYAVSNGVGAGTGHLVYGISFANHSATPCSLQGVPRLWLIAKQGTVVPLVEVQQVGGYVGTGANDTPQSLLPANQPAPVPHRGVGGAYVLFEWYYCGGTPPDIIAVDLKIPSSSGSTRVPLLNEEGSPKGPSRCDDPSQGRQLIVGPIQSAPDQIPAAGPKLGISLEAPSSFHAGELVKYQVTVTNVSGAPISFDTCPNYEEGFTPDRMASYELNCRLVGWLEAGASLTFAMEFAVPRDMPTGEEKFLWRLNGFDTMAFANKVVTVTAP
jgi:Protein of unknown function (DUF4232)